MKLMMAAFDVLAIAALFWLLRVAGRDPRRTADLCVAAAAGVGIRRQRAYRCRGRRPAGAGIAVVYRAAGSSWTGIVLAAAVLTKFLPAAVLPAFWHPRDWRLPVAFAITVLVLYLAVQQCGLARIRLPRRLYVARKASPTATASSCCNSSVRSSPLPDWAGRLYIAAGAGCAGHTGSALCFRHGHAGSAGRACRRAVASGADPWRRIAGDGVAALSVVFRLARTAGLPRADPQRALDAGGRAAACAWRDRASRSCPASVYVPAAILALLDLRRIRRLHIQPQTAGSA